MKPLAALLFLALVACDPQPTATETIGPDGKAALVVSCNYPALECFVLLGRNCRRGYDILAKIEQASSSSLVARCRQ